MQCNSAQQLQASACHVCLASPFEYLDPKVVNITFISSAQLAACGQLCGWCGACRKSNLLRPQGAWQVLTSSHWLVKPNAICSPGRPAHSLVQELGDEVVASIMAQFDEVAADDCAWHGACLALAELARRGLLLPERLPEAARTVSRALAYDIRRGAHRCARHAAQHSKQGVGLQKLLHHTASMVQVAGCPTTDRQFWLKQARPWRLHQCERLLAAPGQACCHRGAHVQSALPRPLQGTA